ncbi:ParB/RepB/Spo0J family partition protein [Pseudogemmobacter sonorensis]|uniref:ParB/RepB/Spo0J family partition protein n=1 Tax=Pseudogemmobacter sonorensis TaxID=2989681 RepID=UPI0036C87CAB
MTAPRLMQQQTRALVAEVIIGDRLRPVSEAGVESLIASIRQTGVMKDAIHVRKKKDGKLVLIAGAHRLEAARRLGWEYVEVKIWTDVTDDWSRLMEVDDNLAGAEMNALDTAVFLAERKRLYEKLHPETRADAFHGNRHTGKLASDIVSFASSTAEKFGLSKRQIERIVAAGSALTRDEVRNLRAAPAPVTLKDLTEIARIPEDHDRAMVVLKLAGGNAKSASAARRQLETEEGRAPTVDPMKQSEAEFRAIAAAWKRAGAAARRRFIAEVLDREGGSA